MEQGFDAQPMIPLRPLHGRKAALAFNVRNGLFQGYEVHLTEKVGSPDWIRTSYLVLRRHALYPNELRDHFHCTLARAKLFLRRQTFSIIGALFAGARAEIYRVRPILGQPDLRHTRASTIE